MATEVANEFRFESAAEPTIQFVEMSTRINAHAKDVACEPFEAAVLLQCRRHEGLPVGDDFFELAVGPVDVPLEIGAQEGQGVIEFTGPMQIGNALELPVPQ